MVKYRPAAKNIRADVLSRVSEPENNPDLPGYIIDPVLILLTASQERVLEWAHDFKSSCHVQRMETTSDFLPLNETDYSDLLCETGIENGTFTCLEDYHHNATLPRKDLHQTVRILLYSLIFFLSVLGNTLVITVLIRNARMRTVTNIFLLSLAVSDLMLCLFCMPFTLIPNLLRDFIFGSAVCKTATYFMGISVSVSTFNLVAISLERYSAICKPLQSRVWQTKAHALKVIAATWCFSFTIMSPYPIYSTLVPFTKSYNSTGNMCRLLWPNDVTQQSWYIFLLLILFLVPGIVMMIAYGLISLELYRGIKFDVSQRKYSAERKNSISSNRYEDGDGCYLQKTKRRKRMEMQQLSTSSSTRIDRVRSSSSAASLLAKKRVIRMLIVIVILFFLCWTPIFSANAWRAFDTTSADLLLSGAPISFIHLLSYTSACVNPVVYCFMNKRFRLGFLATFTCCPRHSVQAQAMAAGRAEEYSRTTGATLSRHTYTNVSMSGATTALAPT
ncbi:cholecystokinin receptor type A [Rhinatrema bivittatum]|uniref:cholecystokinin receptor type A n=1 Tax=Rhinatrema bivittatum TaxID=194408 RepID=UPI00112D05A6|nr:cholecystokinin receptor type A [Rhinatrema bivittatum]